MNQKDEGGESWQVTVDIPVTDKFREWIDEAAKALGMDICAMDGVHSKADDKEYIIERLSSNILTISKRLCHWISSSASRRRFATCSRFSPSSNESSIPN